MVLAPVVSLISCNLTQWYLGTCARSQHQVSDAFRRIARLFAETADDVIRLATYKDLRNGLAANGEFYQIGHVRDIQSVLGNTVTVCYNLKLGKGRFLIYGNIRRARYLLDDIDNFIGNMTLFP